ncbi:hypothetical protein [Maridesulfovibrio bastinii]|uniref:hypothetical protein n=1 Tax=Maridesulfovibrio bastinii TaxID=47157 RepID=UPI00146F97A0|nr:hypothetical protein [Maridesulfovibrio bastinii]
MSLTEKLGVPLTPDEAGKILGVSGNSMRKHYRRWGGVEVVPGNIRFFENILEEKINANIRQTAEVGSSCEGGKTIQGRKSREVVSRRKSQKLACSQTLGGRKGERIDEEILDEHGLLC